MTGYNEWLDGVIDGEQSATAGSFARHAIGEIPKIDKAPARLTNWRAWGFKSAADMRRAYYPEDCEK